MELPLALGGIRYLVAFVLALLLSLYFTPIIRRGAISYGVLDRPSGDLKTHKEPTPYLGGVAIYVSFLFALAFTYEFTREVLGILLAASIVVTLGLFDDLKVLSPGVKLVGQIVAALVLIKAGIQIHLSFLPAWAAAIFTVFWIVGATNAINLVDVSDGLAAGVASVAGVFLYVIALWNGDAKIAMLTLSLVGATLGFLAYNRPPARIFMGDTGSMFLGFMLGSLAMIGQYTSRNPLAAVTPVLLLGVPIFDTLFVMGARAVRGLPIMRGSPDHFAVRLRKYGFPALRIAALAVFAQGVLGGIGLAMVRSKLETAAIWLSAAVLLGLLAAGALIRLGRDPEERAARRR